MQHKCLLIDDEPLAVNVLESYISMMPMLELSGKCSNAFEALKILQTTKIDIIFLDIKMPRLTGTEFLRNLPSPPKTIFTTAYKDYAVEAFELNAIDYLLKPVSLQRFIKSINKIVYNTESSISSEHENIWEYNKSFLYFRVERKMVKVLLDDILYIESLKDYIKIFRLNEKPILVKQAISSIEDMLPKHKFVRIHRSFIISIIKIRSFTNQDVDVCGQEIPIGRMYQQHLKTILNVDGRSQINFPAG